MWEWGEGETKNEERVEGMSMMQQGVVGFVNLKRMDEQELVR